MRIDLSNWGISSVKVLETGVHFSLPLFEQAARPTGQMYRLNHSNYGQWYYVLHKVTSSKSSIGQSLSYLHPRVRIRSRILYVS